MPPKSNRKEQAKTLWYTCDKCDLKILSNQLTFHQDNGCTNTFGIRENVLQLKLINCNALPQELELKDAPALYLQRFVFVPETISKLCNLTNDYGVLIEIGGNKKYVRRLWTISDKHVDSVYSNSSELKFEQERGEGNFPVKISKLSDNTAVKIARQIILKSDESISDTKDIERLIRAKLKSTVIHLSNIVRIDFLCKKISFTIVAIDERDKSNGLSDKLSKMTLNDEEFFFIQSDTLISLRTDCDEKNHDDQQRLTVIEQIGGLGNIFEEVRRVADIAVNSGKAISNDQGALNKVSRGVLIYGLSGSGKTLLSEALANSFGNAHKIKIKSYKIFSRFYGESENNLKKLFEEAEQVYPTPCIIIIDEIANLCPKNDTSDVIRKVSSLLISLIDRLHTTDNGSKSFVIATTSSLDTVDPVIRRSGRLDYEIEIPVPNTQMREEILEKMLKDFNFDQLQIKELAKLTHGFVSADLQNLILKSKLIENGKVSLSFSDILAKHSSVKPSAMRELLVEKPNVKWTDIGGMHDLKLKLKQIVEWPLKYPEAFSRLRINPPRGLLMFGPPGCSKTMIAKALANESNMNFISIKGSDLFSMWVGESEKAVRDLFIKARQLSPCIIFFDEIDAIGGERENGSSVKERVLAQILTEIDGVNSLKDVIIIAATNRPDLIDSALMRPGRLDRIVYVQLPDEETRKEIFKIKLNNVPIASDVDIKELVRRTEGYSGAEIEAVCREAALKALEYSFDTKEISMKYYEKALAIITPRTNSDLLKLYSDYERRK